MAAVWVVGGFNAIEDYKLSGGTGGWDDAAEAFGFAHSNKAISHGIVAGIVPPPKPLTVTPRATAISALEC